MAKEPDDAYDRVLARIQQRGEQQVSLDNTLNRPLKPLPGDATRSWDQTLDFYRTFFQLRGIEPSDQAMVRAALASVEGVATIESIVTSQVLAGFNAGADTTAGWVRNVPMPNFLPNHLAHSSRAVRLNRIGTNVPAATIKLSLNAQGWKIARFAAQFTISEVDLLNTQNLGLMEIALQEVGAAVKRLVPDLVYSLILTNAALDDDDVPLFHADRGNVGADVLASGPLQTAWGAIGSQVILGENDEPNHLNLVPKFLITSPTIAVLSHQLNEAIGGQLVVRQESRLSDVGLVDPRDDELITNVVDNAWMLACAAAQAPGIAVGYLDGVQRPSLRTFRLEQGQWGVGFDLLFDVGVTAVSGKPLYYNAGHA